MEQRQRPALLAKTGEYTVTELSQRFGVSRRTAHEWIGRFEREGLGGGSATVTAPHARVSKIAIGRRRFMGQQGWAGDRTGLKCRFHLH